MSEDTARSYPVQKSEDEWRAELSPGEYHVLRRAGTERPFSHPYAEDLSEGYTYSCRACGAELFHSDHKFASYCGWPSFHQPLAEDRVAYVEDRSLGMKRVEVRCARCGSHLGHVFEGEGYATPTDLRYCVNGVALRREESPAG